MITTAASGSIFHDLPEEIEAFAAVGPRAFEVEIQKNRIGAFALEERKELGGRTKRLDALEHLAQRETCGEGNVGIVVDDDRKVEDFRHATSVAQLSGNEQCHPQKGPASTGTTLAAISAMSGGHILILQGFTLGRAASGPSISGQKLFGGGQ